MAQYPRKHGQSFIEAHVPLLLVSLIVIVNLCVCVGERGCYTTYDIRVTHSNSKIDYGCITISIILDTFG
jgi:hypothetical protein